MRKAHHNRLRMQRWSTADHMKAVIEFLFSVFRVDLAKYVRFEATDVVEEAFGVCMRRRKDMYAQGLLNWLVGKRRDSVRPSDDVLQISKNAFAGRGNSTTKGSGYGNKTNMRCTPVPGRRTGTLPSSSTSTSPSSVSSSFRTSLSSQSFTAGR